MDILIPFNFKPVLSGCNSSSYQPASGNYARVVITASVTAYASNGSVSGGQSNFGSIEIWINSSNVVTGTNVTASGSTSSPTGGISSVQMTLDGNDLMRVEAMASLAVSGTFGGLAKYQIAYQEYAPIT